VDGAVGVECFEEFVAKGGVGEGDVVVDIGDFEGRVDVVLNGVEVDEVAEFATGLVWS
jgi:hypothetical protein